MHQHADFVAIFRFVGDVAFLNGVHDAGAGADEGDGVQGNRQLAAGDIVGVIEEGRVAVLAAVIENLLAFKRDVGIFTQRLHPRLNIAFCLGAEVAPRVLVGEQGVEGVVAIEDGINEGINGVAADIGFFEEAFGARDQQILRQNFVAFEQQPGLQHDAMKLQEGAVAEGEGAEEGEIDMRRLQRQIV